MFVTFKVFVFNKKRTNALAYGQCDTRSSRLKLIANNLIVITDKQKDTYLDLWLQYLLVE